MPVQTSYSLNHNEAYQGQIADLQLANTISKLNKSGANIPYGYGVIRDGDDSAKISGAAFTAGEIVGIVVRELDRAYADGEVFGAKDGYSMTILTAGPIWVTAINAVNDGDDVFMAQDGTIQNVNTGGAIQIPGARFTTTATAGALAKISLVIGG